MPTVFGIFMLANFLQIICPSTGQSPFSSESEASEAGRAHRNDHPPPLPPRYVPKFSRFTPFQTVESLPGPQFGRPSLAPSPSFGGGNSASGMPPPPLFRRHPFEGDDHHPPRGNPKGNPRGNSPLSSISSSHSNSRENGNLKNSRERIGEEEEERHLNAKNDRELGEMRPLNGGNKIGANATNANGSNFGKERANANANANALLELPSTFPRPSQNLAEFSKGQKEVREKIVPTTTKTTEAFSLNSTISGGKLALIEGVTNKNNGTEHPFNASFPTQTLAFGPPAYGPTNVPPPPTLAFPSASPPPFKSLQTPTNSSSTPSSLSTSSPSNVPGAFPQIHAAPSPPSNLSNFQSKLPPPPHSPLMFRPNVPYGPELVARLANQNYWPKSVGIEGEKREEDLRRQTAARNEGNGNGKFPAFSGENGGKKWNGPSKVVFTPSGGRFPPKSWGEQRGNGDASNSRENEGKRGQNVGRHFVGNERGNDGGGRQRGGNYEGRRFGGGGDDSSFSAEQRGRNLNDGRRRPFGGFGGSSRGRSSEEFEREGGRPSQRESAERPEGQFEGRRRFGGSREEAENSGEFGRFPPPPQARPPFSQRQQFGSGSGEENERRELGHRPQNSQENGGGRNSRERQQNRRPPSEFSNGQGGGEGANPQNNRGRPFEPPRGIPNPGEFLPEHIRSAFPPFPEPFERRNNQQEKMRKERKRRAGEVKMDEKLMRN